jgi:rhodanese-related sulfurtransferase
MSNWWWLPIGRVPDIEALDLQARLNQHEPLQVIDVRTTVEYQSGHIDGAINVPIDQLRATLPALDLDPARPVVAICATAHRSIPAVRLLKRAGYDARQLRGGMITWWRARLPTVKTNTR